MGDEKWIECGSHGRRLATYVCRHLVESLRTRIPVGFQTADDEAHSDAWCDACEGIRSQEGEWNDRSEAFAKITLLCSGCYDRAKELSKSRN